MGLSICKSFKKTAYFLVSFLFMSTSLLAQNARFSQISSAPLQLNPGLAGRIDGGIEFKALSSWQRSQSTTISHQYFHIQVNTDFKKRVGNKEVIKDSVVRKGINKPKKANSYWGWGLNYYQYGKDLTGIAQNTTPLSAYFITGSVAKHYFFNGDAKHYLGFGLSATYAAGQVREQKDYFNDKEISGGGFRYRPTFRNNASSKKQYIDWNLGGYYGFKQSNFYYEVGFSMAHLFYPRNDILDDAETKLRHRAALHSVFGIKLSKKIDIIQKNVFWSEGLYFRSRAVDTTQILALWSGVEFRQKHISDSNKISFEGGIYTRSFKTVLPFATIYLGRSFSVRLSHEFPINSPQFKAYTAERTELSLTYNIGRKLMRQKEVRDKYLNW